MLIQNNFSCCLKQRYILSVGGEEFLTIIKKKQKKNREELRLRNAMCAQNGKKWEKIHYSP